MRRLLPVLVLVLAAAAPAAAQTAPASARIRLELQRVGAVSRPVALAGRPFRVRGTVTPYVAGQAVRLRLYRQGRLVAVRTQPVLPEADGTAGTFVASFRAAAPGRYRIGAAHLPTPEMAYARAVSPAVAVVAPALAPGATGFSVGVVQRLLRDRGYVPGRPGVYDARTARAVLAFRKVSRLARTTVAARVVLRRLVAGGGRFRVRFPRQGRHVEADLGRQVLALVDRGRAVRIYPMSSGKPATPTILGSFRVYRKDAGTNSLGMVHSSYFIRGYAIHGYESVPTFPASHGCLRVPIPDAWLIFRWIRMGDRVDTYYRPGERG